MIRINETVYIDPSQVTAIQDEVVRRFSSGSPSDCSTEIAFDGSIVVLKCGRKIAVNGLKPDAIHKMLFGVIHAAE